MNLVRHLLQVPWLWDLSQRMFGCDEQKRLLYRSVLRHPCKVLDFGCADGNAFPAFMDCDYYGMDIDPRLIAYAKRKYAAYPNAHFVCADVLKSPFPPSSFDAVIFGCTGHHLSDSEFLDIMGVLIEMLREGGAIHFFDPIKDPARDPWIVKVKMAFDQGKHIRTQEQYHCLLEKLGGVFYLKTMHRLQVAGALTPQPTYLYVELRRQNRHLPLGAPSHPFAASRASA